MDDAPDEPLLPPAPADAEATAVGGGLPLALFAPLAVALLVALLGAW